MNARATSSARSTVNESAISAARANASGVSSVYAWIVATRSRSTSSYSPGEPLSRSTRPRSEPSMRTSARIRSGISWPASNRPTRSIASVWVSSRMRSTLSPRCFADVTCFTAAAGPSIAWSTVCREVWSASGAATRVDASIRTDGGMSLLRSARFPAILLLVAAIAGLVVANSPIGAAVDRVLAHAPRHPRHRRRSVARALGLGRAARDLLLLGLGRAAVRADPRASCAASGEAIQPAIAAAGGVIVPIAVYLAFTAGSGRRSGLAGARPRPTSPSRSACSPSSAGACRPALRVFLLALAILDDIVGIVFIAVLFATDVNFGMLAARAAGGRRLRDPEPHARHAARACRSPSLLVLLAITTWVLVLASGVHATIAGVLLGLAMAQRPALRVRHAIEPWVNGVVLPIFAFSAALVADPAGVGIASCPRRSGASWSPCRSGKIVGIAGAGWLVAAHRRRGGGDRSSRSATCSPPARSAASASRSRCCWPSSRSPTHPSCATRRSSACSPGR